MLKYTPMKTLIITAHPSSKGFTHAIAKVLKEERESKQGEVEILDLYRTDLKQPYLSFEDVREMKNLDPVREVIHSKMEWADEYIVIHPLWWLGMPAVMKNFLDNNITSPFAYHYDAKGRHPSLYGKRARLYITADQSFWLYVCLGLPFIVVWVIGIFTFCGIRTDYFKVIRMMKLKQSEELRVKMLESVKKNSWRRSVSLHALNFLGNMFQ